MALYLLFICLYFFFPLILPSLILYRWGNVLGIHVKTDESIALPLYTRMPVHPLDQEMKDEQEDSTEVVEIKAASAE